MIYVITAEASCCRSSVWAEFWCWVSSRHFTCCSQY